MRIKEKINLFNKKKDELEKEKNELTTEIENVLSEVCGFQIYVYDSDYDILKLEDFEQKCDIKTRFSNFSLYRVNCDDVEVKEKVKNFFKVKVILH
jgi:hypothetical protein